VTSRYNKMVMAQYPAFDFSTKKESMQAQVAKAAKAKKSTEEKSTDEKVENEEP